MKKLIIALVLALLFVFVPITVRAAEPIDEDPLPEDYVFVRLEGREPVSNKATITALMVKVIIENEYPEKDADGNPDPNHSLIDDWISTGVRVGFYTHFWATGAEPMSTDWVDELVYNQTGTYLAYFPVERVSGSFGDYVSKSGWKFDFLWYAKHLCAGGETCEDGEAEIRAYKNGKNEWYHFDATLPGRNENPINNYKTSKILSPDKSFRIQWLDKGKSLLLSGIKLGLTAKGVAAPYRVVFEFYSCDAPQIATDRDLGASFPITKDGRKTVGFKEQTGLPEYGFDDWMIQSYFCKKWVRAVGYDDKGNLEFCTLWQLIK